MWHEPEIEGSAGGIYAALYARLAGTMSCGTIYVLSDGTAVKIGFTMNNPRTRLESCQTGNPRKIELLTTTLGTIEDESRVHRMLSAFRLCGEWFEDCKPVEAVVHAIDRSVNMAALFADIGDAPIAAEKPAYSVYSDPADIVPVFGLRHELGWDA